MAGILFSDVEISVKYSSNGRIDITSVVEKWRTHNKDSIKSVLESAGIKNYVFREKNGEDLSTKDYQIVGITINYNPYTEGECYIQKGVPVAIDFYRAKINIGDRYEYYTQDKKMRYQSVVEELKKLGFTNIHLYRNNALIAGIVDSEGSIASFKIDGNKGFLAEDTFYRDAKIEIVVNTKKSGCEDITEIKK